MIEQVLTPNILEDGLPGELRERLRKALGQDDIEDLVALREAVKAGRQIDWAMVAPLIEIRHDQATYEPPRSDHGAHVAGIIGAVAVGNAAADGHEDSGAGSMGMCPDIRLYDLRVPDAREAGEPIGAIAGAEE